MAIHEDRNGCALHGALRLLGAIDGVVPILHASPGCGVAARVATEAYAGGHGELSTGTQELSATILQEKQVVFGGTSRLREQIKNTVKVQEGDLYVVVTGCVPEIVGDDVPAMVKEAREQRFPVLGIGAPGFKGHAWSGYVAAAKSLLEQLPEIIGDESAAAPADVNLLGIVPGQDPGWEGDLLEIEAILAEVGLRTHRLVGFGQGVREWRQAARARVNVVLSPWGIEAARLLGERRGTPVVDLGWLPVGSRDAGLLLARVGEALALDPAVVDAARTRLDARLRHFLRKAAASLLLGDVQERVAVVGGTAAAVGQARFLAGTLGQLVEHVVVTDDPPEDRRPAILEAVRSVAGAAAEVAFLSSRRDIDTLLRSASPELILGSALEAKTAHDVGAALVETAAPLRVTHLLRRGHGGVDGAVTLVEDVLAALRRTRAEAASRGDALKTSPAGPPAPADERDPVPRCGLAVPCRDPIPLPRT